MPWRNNVTDSDAATRKQRRMSAPQRQEETRVIIRRYQAGESIRQIAAVLGRSYGTVHRRLYEAGVAFRPRGGNRRRTGARPTRTR
jgi:DNA-directed RNA polymerase specialized sigma24 family protein